MGDRHPNQLLTRPITHMAKVELRSCFTTLPEVDVGTCEGGAHLVPLLPTHTIQVRSHDDEHRRLLSHRCQRCAMGRSAAPAAQSQVASRWTRTEALGAAPRYRRDFLREQDGVPMAHDAQAYRQWADELWRLPPLAARGRLGTGHGDAAPVGAPEPRPATRTVR